MISAGAKKDLLILEFCQALLVVSKTDDAKSDNSLVNRQYTTDYHINKRIDRAIDKIIDRAGVTIKSIVAKEGYELAKWLKMALNNKIVPALKSITTKTINLEMLALWIMFANFSERNKTLIPELREYEDANQYIRVVELIGNTEVARLEGELFDEAYNIIAMLKG